MRFTLPFGPVVVALVMALTVGVAPPAAASSPEKTAEVLHKRATKAYRKGERREAMELWREALTAHRFWKYAYNLANASYEAQALLDAWNGVDTAEELGVPQQYQQQLLELRAKIRTALLVDHAQITLEVTPGEAEVRRNDAVWQAPRTVWTRSARSEIKVSAQGYHAVSLTWDHAPGSVWRKTISLRPITTGALVVRGTPEGAAVLVNGKASGALPQVGPLSLPPGQYIVTVSADGYLPLEREVRVELGKSHSVELALVKKPEPLPKPAPPPDLATPGWVLLASGVAVAAGGGGLFAWSDTLFGDIQTLNSDPDVLKAFPDYDAYLQEHRSRANRYEAVRGSGIALMVIGSAALVTGVILVALDESSSDTAEDGSPDKPEPTEPEVGWHLGVGPQGAQVGASWRF